MITATEAAQRLDLIKSGRGWRGACPSCGYATTFLLKARRGEASGWCASCQNRDGIDAYLRAMDGSDAVEAVIPRPDASGPTDAQRSAKALTIWNGAVDAHTALATYCESRGLPRLERSKALRWRPDVRHPEAKGLYPAMIAVVQDVEGEPIAVHRTYLQRDGRGKADMAPQRASKGPIAGGAIRLDDPQPEILVGEGIESSAAAARMLSLPAWSAVSAGTMERTMQLPDLVHAVVIAADPDMPGQRAADGAARRWAAEGRAIRIITPNIPGFDFADLYAAGVR